MLLFSVLGLAQRCLQKQNCILRKLKSVTVYPEQWLSILISIKLPMRISLIFGGNKMDNPVSESDPIPHVASYDNFTAGMNY